MLPKIETFTVEVGWGGVHGSTALRAWDVRPATAGVLTGGGEAFVACGPNFKPLGRLVAEISVET